MSKTLSRSSSLGGLSDNSFNLQGFESERVELDKLIVTYKDKIDEYAQSGNFSVENILSCPLGVSYFYKFLSEEFNKENILAFYELKSLLDYLLYSKKKMDWVIDTSDVYRDDISDVSSISSANSSFVSNANSEQSIKYVNTTSVDEIRECFKRIQQFKKTYFDSSSLYEINISSTMKKKVLESISFTKEVQDFISHTQQNSGTDDDSCSTNSCSQKIEETLNTMHSNLEKIQTVLEELKTDLLHNLSDPFQRFMSSDEMYECMALFLSSQGDDTYHRERVLNANKGEGVVLNQPEGYLAIIGKTMGDLQVVHPITKITQLLESLLNVIQADIKYFRKTSCESNEAESVIELNFDDLGKSETCCNKYEKFQHETFDLAHCDLSLLKSDEEKLTFFINAYNLLLLHALLVSGSMPQVEVTNIIFYRKVRYNLGGQEYSLQDIFNGILQCNQMKCLIYGKAFKKNDARKANIPSKTFPEVYFGLINMTKYSPKLRVYEPTSLLEKLKENTKDYFDRYVQVLPSDQHPTELLEIALPSQLKEQKHELKNFWKTDVTTVIKTVNNLSTASFNSSSQSLTSLESRQSIDSSSLSDVSTSRSISSAEADMRKNVLEYLMETYHPELNGGKHELTNKTKYTYKKYEINPPNWFTVFNEEFQKSIIEQYQVQIPAAGELLLPKKAKENNCPIAALFSKFSRTTHLCENASKIINKEVSPKSSEDSSPTNRKKLFGRGRASAIWNKKTFKKKEVSIVDFLLGRKKDKPVSNNNKEKKHKNCVIA